MTMSKLANAALRFATAPVFVGLALVRRFQAALREREGELRKAREELETAVAKRTADLAASEERYALAMMASDQGFWDWDVAGDKVYVSPRLVEMYGLPPGTRFAGREDFRRRAPFHPDDFREWTEAKEVLFAGRGTRLDKEMRVLRGGETRWVHATGFATRDASGAVVRWTGATRDITEHKRAEEALRQSEKRYERAMLSANAGHWDWDVVTDDYYASPRLLEMSGLSRGARFSGREDFMRQTGYPPEEREKWLLAVRRLFASEESRLAMELRTIVHGERRWLAFDGICSRDANGIVVRWTGSATDVTERKCAEEALRVSEERYARAMEASDAGHWDWDLLTDHMFVSERAREMVALPSGPLPATRSAIIALVPMHPEDRESLRERVAAALVTASYERDYRVIPRDGELRWLRSRGKVFRDANGVAVRMTGSLVDITERKLAEEALRVSEQRYARAMEASEAGHFEWDIANDTMFQSARMKEMLGLPLDAHIVNRSECLARHPFLPGERARFEEAFRASFDDPEGRYEIDYQVRLPNGAIRWMRSQGKMFRDAGGRPVRLAGSMTDVTERKRIEQELRERQEMLEVAQKAARTVPWQWLNAADATKINWAPELEAMFGLPPGGYDGKFESWRKMLHPDDWPRVKSCIAHALQTGDIDVEYRVIHPDGSVRWLNQKGRAFLDANGKPVRSIGFMFDVTERHKVEDDLRSRQEMLELAQKSARAIAFEWKIGAGDGENRWSPDLEAMYGFAGGTYDGSFEMWKKVVQPEDWLAVKEAIRHAMSTGEVASEYRVVHPDGSVHWLQAKGRMFFDGAGNATRMVGFMQDITPRKDAENEMRKMEQELRRAQRLEAMGTLAGGIAHDFNNILGAILGYGDVAVRATKKGSRMRRDLESIVAAGERGRALVDRILAFSRSAVGERVAVHVEAVVCEALDHLAAKLPVGVTIEPRLEAGRAAMLGDSTQVHQVVMNLASNAMQAMPSGGVLQVTLEAVRIDVARSPTVGKLGAGDYIVLKVGDTGIGIAPAVLERMFDPFFTTKEVGVGSGLGLSLVHGIVANVGGAIDVATAVGQGSTFIVYFPRSGDAPTEVANARRPLPRGEGQRVLVVDDEEPLVRLASETLERLGYAAIGFTSSVAALAAFRADPQRFDAVLTDERMPGLSGSALIREMRGIRDAIPVVLMSGYLGMDSVEADVVVKKPLSARDLAASMARALGH